MVISVKFLNHKVSSESTSDFSKNCFPTTFGGHLEFLRKMQKKRLSWKQSKIERFRRKF